MRRYKWFLILLLSCVMFCASCTNVAITGRRQLNLVSESKIASMAAADYNDFLRDNKLSSDVANTAMVKRVGERIAQAVETYFRNQGMSDKVSGYQWEFNLIENDQKNAWAMPGGKVVVYEGILPLTQDPTGLAVVMSHEIAHVIANHGNERMSHGLLYELGGVALSEAAKNQPNETRALFMQSYGIGAQLGVLLPYSRLQESEADRLGLIFMAMAGYDPREAVPFWQRMAAHKEGTVPEFLSTHPSDASRINNIQNYLPEALQYYNAPGSPALQNTIPETNRPVSTPEEEWRYGDPVQ